jgi:hypothetical protein
VPPGRIRRQIRLRTIFNTEQAARTALGMLLEQASVDRQPEPDVAVDRLVGRYLQITDWDVSTRESNEGYIRRTIRPARGRVRHPQHRRSAASMKAPPPKASTLGLPVTPEWSRQQSLRGNLRTVRCDCST